MSTLVKRTPCPTCDRECDCDGLKIEVSRPVSAIQAHIALREFGRLDDSLAEQLLDVLDSAREFPEDKNYYLTVRVLGEQFDATQDTVDADVHWEVQTDHDTFWETEDSYSISEAEGLRFLSQFNEKEPGVKHRCVKITTATCVHVVEE